jgi:hypothetical protein
VNQEAVDHQPAKLLDELEDLVGWTLGEVLDLSPLNRPCGSVTIEVVGAPIID